MLRLKHPRLLMMMALAVVGFGSSASVGHAGTTTAVAANYNYDRAVAFAHCGALRARDAFPAVAWAGTRSSGIDLAAKGLPDEALVVRGGENTAERFVGGNGVSLDDAGRLHGVSVNSAPGRSLRELTQGIPNKQVGVTTVGDVRKAGGYVRPDLLPDNPFHCLLGGCTPQQFSDLFTPTTRNPWTG